MRVVVTGAAGFIGRAIVRQLAARGDHVVALVRDPATATHIAAPTVELVASDLSDVAVPDRAHARRRRAHPRRRLVPGRHPRVGAAGDARCERRARPNACSMPRSPRACRGSSTSRRSTPSATRAGRSSTRRTGATRRTASSATTTRRSGCAQVAAERRIADGAPIIIVQPGVTYGPGDHSSVGQQLAPGVPRHGGVHRPRQPWHQPGPRRRPGGRDPRCARSRHVRAGPTRSAARTSASRRRWGSRRGPAGHGPPRLNDPELVPADRGVAGPEPRWRVRAVAQPARDPSSPPTGVTYWASSARAAAELGYRPRDLASGFADAFGGGTR